MVEKKIGLIWMAFWNGLNRGHIHSRISQECFLINDYIDLITFPAFFGQATTHTKLNSNSFCLR